jgi:16S rRNA A1518/A1519 N6-dimethyltransferase RsmA/KsgA/DIM1 with predicted DNA glycosylase/AP lyase activity
LAEAILKALLVYDSSEILNVGVGTGTATAEHVELVGEITEYEGETHNRS